MTEDPTAVKLVDVTPDGPDQAAVDSILKRTLPAGVEVVGIQRVQSVALWQQYALRRLALARRDGVDVAAAALERMWLFHPCEPDAVGAIASEGFNRLLTSPTKRYGKGTYFARDATFAAEPMWSSSQCVNQIVATPARWRGVVVSLVARFSQHGLVLAEKRLREEFSVGCTQLTG